MTLDDHLDNIRSWSKALMTITTLQLPYHIKNKLVQEVIYLIQDEAEIIHESLKDK